jgi:hypothetical protein
MIPHSLYPLEYNEVNLSLSILITPYSMNPSAAVVESTKILPFSHDAFAKTLTMAKQKFRPTRLGGFSGAKAYIQYVEVLKKRRNAVGRTFCDAIRHHRRYPPENTCISTRLL